MINWKVRFRNKKWLYSFCALVISFVYQIIASFEIIPAISENTVMQFLNIVLMILTAGGVIIDPTTDGLGDSKRALTYEEPANDGSYYYSGDK